MGVPGERKRHCFLEFLSEKKKKKKEGIFFKFSEKGLTPTIGLSEKKKM